MQITGGYGGRGAGQDTRVVGRAGTGLAPGAGGRMVVASYEELREQVNSIHVMLYALEAREQGFAGLDYMEVPELEVEGYENVGRPA